MGLLYDNEHARDLFFGAVKKSGLPVIEEAFYRFRSHIFTRFSRYCIKVY